MGLKRRSSEDGEDSKKIVAENLDPSQEYEARLVYVADLGLHENSYKGELKPDVQKIALGYEVLGETIEIDGEDFPRILWDNPFNIYYSMTPNGKELEVYKMFDPKAKENEIADWEKALGAAVSLTIEQVADKKDPKVLYDNISSVQPIPKKYQKGVAKALTKVAVGDADDKDNPVTQALYGLSKWMYDRRLTEGAEPVVKTEEPVFNPDDEIPF